MFKRFGLFLIAALFSLQVFAIPPVIEKIASLKSDSGTFIQMKTLSDVGVTLASSGEFKFEKGKFFEWKTLKPMEGSFTATPEEYVSSIKGGKTSKRPLSKIKMSNAMKALIDGDVSVLEEVFKLKISDKSITAYPKTRELSEFVDSFTIELDGNAKPVRFVLTFTNSDVLDIVLKRK